MGALSLCGLCGEVGARSAVARLPRAWLLSPRERVSRPRSLRAACVTKFPRGGRFVTHAMRTLFPRCRTTLRHRTTPALSADAPRPRHEKRSQQLQLIGPQRPAWGSTLLGGGGEGLSVS